MKKNKHERIPITLTNKEKEFFRLVCDKNPKSKLNKSNVCYHLMRYGLNQVLMDFVREDLTNFRSVIENIVIKFNNGANVKLFCDNLFEKNKLKGGSEVSLWE